MLNPTIKPDQASININLEPKPEINFDWLDQDVEQFEPPENSSNTELLEFVQEDEENRTTLDDKQIEEPKVSPQRKRARANKNAKSIVGMGASGFASFAAIYAKADSSEFLIDEDDQKSIIEPLSDVIYENEALDLPPGWTLIIAALIAFVPMIIKAIYLRKDNNALKEKEEEEKKEPKVIDLIEKKDKNSETNTNFDQDQSKQEQDEKSS